MYLLEMGAVEQNLIKQAVLQGQPIPDKIANAPELQEGLTLYLNAFFELDSERSHSMGLTPIPASAIRAYAREKEFDADQSESLLFYIRKMDAANLERLDNERK